MLFGLALASWRDVYKRQKEYCTREDGKYKILLVKSVYKNKEGKEKDILTYGILDVANKKYICHTANIDVAQRLERYWEFYNQITLSLIHI